jgi:uncharacterized protein
MDLKLSRYVVITRSFKDRRDGVQKCIIYSTRSGQTRVMPRAYHHFLERGQLDQLPHDVVKQLVLIEALVPADEDELSTILAENTAAAGEGEELYYVIQPTASCQLGCGYCGQAHTNKLLSEDDQTRTLARLEERLRRRSYRRLAIAWFGAEPLMGLPVIRSFTPRAQALAAEQGCTYVAKVVTNGLALTPATARELVETHGVNQIEITLDGTAEFHDARRHTKKGTATFAKIYEHLIALCRSELDVKISVRCNVDRRNADGVAPLIAQLAADGVHQRLRFYCASVYDWGNDAHELALPIEEYAAREIEWLAYMERLGFGVRYVPGRKRVVCMAVRPQSELVDAYGNLFNCTEVSYVPAYGEPNLYRIGTSGGGETPGARKRLALTVFNERVAAGQYDCPSCRMLPVCGGGCPKRWDEGKRACPAAKFNIEQRLLVEYAVTRQGEHAA